MALLGVAFAAVVGLDFGVDHRQAGDGAELAPSELPTLLAVEVEAAATGEALRWTARCET